MKRTLRRRPLSDLRVPRSAFALLFACAFLALMPHASAVILMVVLDEVTLFEIEGVTFTSYSTSAHGTLRVENTDTGETGLIDLQGQSEARSDLTLCAFSRDDPRQKVRLENEGAPVFRSATRNYFQ